MTTNGLSSSGAASAPAGTTFTVTGNALSQDAVARVLDRLALIPALSDVSLQSMQRADVAGKKAMQFTIVANVRTSGRERLMKDKLTPKVVAALGVAAVAAVALIGWFGLVSPQRSKAAELDNRIADAKTQLVVLNGTTTSPSGASTVGASRSVLTRAMPRSVAMSTVLRQLQRAARQAGVRLDSLTPQAATAQAGYSTVPMDVVVTGRYFGVQRFLKHLRTQAGVSGSRAHASGRLFSVDSVSLAAGEDQLPQLAATIHLNVFTYSGSAGAAAPTATPTRRGRFDLGLCECRRRDTLMTVVETHIGGRRAAARDAAETRKKIVLAVLAVVLLALLAFQLPKIMKSSSSSSSTASTSLVTPASPVVTARRQHAAPGCGREAPAPDPAAGGQGPVRAAHSREHDHVLVRVDAGFDAALAPLHALGATRRLRSPPVDEARPRQAGRADRCGDLDERPPPGDRPWADVQVGEVQFRLVAVTRKAVRLKVVGGAFAAESKRSRVRKGHPLKLANTATGVQYRLLFERGPQRLRP